MQLQTGKEKISNIECTLNIPCPNLMQMRSSTMQIARESQQNAPNFFTGFLKISKESVLNEKRNLFIRLLEFSSITYVFASKTNGEKKREYLSWRYELYSRMVGIAISHHRINLYTTTGFRGGIQRQNFRKNVLSSTVMNTMQRLRT